MLFSFYPFSESDPPPLATFNPVFFTRFNNFFFISWCFFRICIFEVLDKIFTLYPNEHKYLTRHSTDYLKILKVYLNTLTETWIFFYYNLDNRTPCEETSFSLCHTFVVLLNKDKDVLFLTNLLNSYETLFGNYLFLFSLVRLYTVIFLFVAPNKVLLATNLEMFVQTSDNCLTKDSLLLFLLTSNLYLFVPFVANGIYDSS